MASKEIERLLKSSLPLEHQVTELLVNNGLHCCGEFPYLRKTENGNAIEFSVDMLATSSYFLPPGEEVSADLHVLVECKYASPSVEWVFSSPPKLEPICFSNPSAPHYIGTHFLMGQDEFNKFETEEYCTRGVSLSSESADPKQIKHACQQLRFAVPNLIDKLTTEYISWADGASSIPVISALVVTNAPLRVIKRGAVLGDFSGAKSMDDVSELKDMVTIFQEPGPEMLVMCREVSERIHEKYGQGYYFSTAGKIFDELIGCVECVRIVSLGYLDQYLQLIIGALGKMQIISHKEALDKYNS